MIEVWRDLTDEFSNQWKKRAQELKSDLQKLIEEDRMVSLGKLAASCAHEINNPIQGLLTFSHLIQEVLAEDEISPADLDQCKKHLSVMSKELERCGNIVSGLLSFSRESSIEYKNINLNDVLQAVINLTRHKMALRRIDLVVQLSLTPLIIYGNDNRLHQCFLNLIFNAIEAMLEAANCASLPNWIKRTSVPGLRFRTPDMGFRRKVYAAFSSPFSRQREKEGVPVLGSPLSMVS